MRLFRASIAVLAAVIIGACTGGTATVSPPATGTPPDRSPVQTEAPTPTPLPTLDPALDPAAIDPCGLLTAAEVQEAIGVQPPAPPLERELPAEIPIRSCIYYESGQGTDESQSIDLGIEQERQSSDFEPSQDERTVVEPVEGLGDHAWWVTQEFGNGTLYRLVVLRVPVVLMINQFGFEDPPDQLRDRAEFLARHALERLSSVAEAGSTATRTTFVLRACDDREVTAAPIAGAAPSGTVTGVVGGCGAPAQDPDPEGATMCIWADATDGRLALIPDPYSGSDIGIYVGLSYSGPREVGEEYSYPSGFAISQQDDLAAPPNVTAREGDNVTLIGHGAAADPRILAGDLNSGCPAAWPVFLVEQIQGVEPLER